MAQSVTGRNDAPSMCAAEAPINTPMQAATRTVSSSMDARAMAPAHLCSTGKPAVEVWARTQCAAQNQCNDNRFVGLACWILSSSRKLSDGGCKRLSFTCLSAHRLV